MKRRELAAAAAAAIAVTLACGGDSTSGVVTAPVAAPVAAATSSAQAPFIQSEVDADSDAALDRRAEFERTQSLQLPGEDERAEPFPRAWLAPDELPDRIDFDTGFTPSSRER